MKTDQRDRLIEAADYAMRQVNGVGLDEALPKVHRLAVWFAQSTEKVKTREELVEVLDCLPDVSWADEKLFIAGCRYAKPLLRLGILALAKDAKRDLPPPPGGRHRLFTTEGEIEVCDAIVKLIRKGTSLQVCFFRVGQQFNASPRTVRRIWEDRDEIAAESHDPDFRTTLNAVKGFLTE
jgi:hypothetical protein